MDIEGSENPCSLCGGTEKMGKKAKSLYGHLVCAKCYYDFGNRRQRAFFVDIVLFRIVFVAITFGIGAALIHEMPTQPGGNPIISIASLILWILFLGKDGLLDGSSPGKKILGLQVMNEETRTPIGFGKSFKRNLILIIPFVPLIVAFGLLKGKRWGDGWAGTRVIWTKYKDRAPFASRELGPHPPSGGFPVVALLVFLIIFGLLAAIAIPNFMRARERAHGNAVAASGRPY